MEYFRWRLPFRFRHEDDEPTRQPRRRTVQLSIAGDDEQDAAELLLLWLDTVKSSSFTYNHDTRQIESVPAEEAPAIVLQHQRQKGSP